MLDVQVKQAPPETVAFVTMSGSYDQTPEGYVELYGWVARHGLEPTGPPHAVYLTPPATSETEAMWELWAPIAETGDMPADDERMGVKHVPEHTVASTVYEGPYEAIAPAYEHLMSWVTQEGFDLVGPPEEIYLTDPDDVPPEHYLTEIRMPVARH